MIRAFIALPLPEAVRSALVLLQHQLPVPRRVEPEAMHLTLLFLGELPHPELEAVHHALDELRAPGFDLQLQGLGLFGGARPRNLHAGVSPQPALDHLQAKVAQAVRGTGLRVARHRFVPHVTLARFTPEQIEDRPRLERAVAGAALFRSEPFAVRGFGLYRSTLRRDGAVYDLLADYALDPPPG